MLSRTTPILKCALAALLCLCSRGSLSQPQRKPPQRNVVIFVADGLRHDSVTPQLMPTLWSIRKNGVHFANSHSLFPTFTTANASAIATGHFLGDTADFSNVIYTGYPLFANGNFGRAPGTTTPFLEEDQILGDLDSHYAGNYLGERTLLSVARQHGYQTAVVGKLGPAGIQDIEVLRPQDYRFAPARTIVLDDFTGHDDGKGHALAVALPDDVLQAIVAAGLANKTPDRSNDCGKTDSCNNGYSGDNTHPGTTSANITQQNYFANAVTKAILPKFTQDGRPFVLVFWSRDPDGTQHNQGDSLHQLTPGINGPTSRKALANADADLKQIVDFINADPKLRNNTDIFITSDHGFATISRHEVNRAMAPTQSYSATFSYKNSDGQLEIPSGSLPNGFLAIDLAHALKLNLFDPDQVLSVADGKNVYRRVDPTGTIPEAVQHPQRGDGLLGEKVEMPDGSDASVIVAANGGSDLIYLPDHDRDRAQAIVEFLSSQDYVGGIFVDYSRYGPIAGALDLTDVSLAGSARLPRPAMAVAFKKFNLQPGDRQTAAQIADTVLQEGQGMHGGLGRDSTFNNMAAIGPDFKQRYTDASPVGNADIAPTVARILGFELPANGRLTGRVAAEALRIGPHATAYSKKVASSPAVHGRRTLLHYQQVGSERYLDEACFLEQSKVACEP